MSLRFEKQIRRAENTLADCRRCLAPGGIQLARFPGLAVILGEDRSHSLAVFQADAHRRYQKLHRHLRRNLPFANLPLNRLRQRLHQRQPPRHPTYAAVEPSRQLIKAVAEALLQLSQEPTNLQRCFLFRQTHGTVEYDGLSFAHRPHHCFHFVAAKLL